MKFKILYVVFICAIGLIFYLLVPKNLSDDNVKIKCNYMAYACGDCYPQFKVKDIIQGNNSEVKKILDSEIEVVFTDDKLQEAVDKGTYKCVICYDFIFTGNLKKSFRKGTYFLAHTVKIKLKNDSCCN